MKRIRYTAGIAGLISLLVLSQAPLATLHAAEHHVAITGSDASPGTPAAPLRTIQRAADLAQPGDTVTVHAGVYRERVNPPRGGESDTKRIVYQAASGEKVVITGSEEVKNWEKVQDGVWKATLPNTFFCGFNPYTNLIQGDWFQSNGPREHHTGAVYLNGDWLGEAAKLDEVLKPAGAAPLWFGRVDQTNTTLWAQFKGVNPNAQRVEINTRQTVFYPEKPGINYITVRGFTLRHAATQWAPPTAEQMGLIGTHWSKGWIIENNTISHSKCSGIALGKYGDQWDNTSAWRAEGYLETIQRALTNGWNKATVGSHLVRNNDISHCEQAGIVGSLGCSFSVVTGNNIHDIHVQRLFGGVEMAGIKFHGAIDVEISRNHLYRCYAGIWLDWMAQGARVSGNLLHDNLERDLFFEANHGPFLVDNNVCLSPVALWAWSEGGAYVHNLFAGEIGTHSDDDRMTPFHQAHSTAIAGLHKIPGGDDRYYNNLFMRSGSLAKYDQAHLPMSMDGNVFFQGAKSSKHESDPILRSASDPALTLVEKDDGFYLTMTLATTLGSERPSQPVTSARLGKASISGCAFENPDGSPITIGTDYFGKPRNAANPTSGPFDAPGTGTLTMKVWPLTFPLAVSAKPVWGTSPIAEPYPYISTGSFSGPAVPESPDPLVAYRWPSPKATDGLEIYLLKPGAVSSDTAASFDNLGSLTTDHPNVTVNGAGSIRMDFGRESAAWLEFDSPDCPGDVEMSISEYNQPGPDKTKAPVKHGNTYRLELNAELYEGVRFAWIHVKAPAKPWHITGIRAVCQVKPTNYDGGFSCSDPMLTKAWYMSAYGVKICLVSNYFSSILMERGDRIPWVGDAPASQAAGLVAFGNSDFVKANIDLTAGGNNGIIAYSLYWVIGLLDYYQYTGDAAMMEKYLKATCEILDHSYQVYGTNPKLKFFGWDERVGTGFEIWYRGGSGAQEAQNAYKMLSIRMWSDFAAAMGAYGRADLQAKYNGYAEAKMAELRKNRDWHSQFGLHALAEVAASGRLNDVERKAIAEKEFHDRVTRLSFDPFCQLFINQAMARINLYDEAFTSIKDVWGGIIKLGGTTPWECYRPSWNSGVGVCDPVPNSQSGITSLCHPWGAGPVKWLNEEVLGIKPTTPGFKTYDVVPHLGRSLTRVAGKTPTPHGEISASFDVNTGTCKVTAPAGTVGRIGIPKVEKTIAAIAVNGTKAWDGVYHAVPGIGRASQDSEFVYLSSVQPGTYSIEVSYSGKTPEYKEPPEKYAAQFIKQDKTTGGDWGGVYGKDGYVLCNYKGERNDEKALPTHVIRGERAEVILNIRNDEKALPSYVTSLEYFRAFPKSGVPDPQMWATETADKRALAPDKHNGSNRKATGYSNDQTMSLTIGIDGEREYQVALYFVDWDRNGCRQAVEMMDAGTLKQVAPVKIVDDFSGGAYLVYQYNKSVKFRINKVRGDILSLSGIFFDPAPVAGAK